MLKTRPLTAAEKKHVHPHMQAEADAGRRWRLPHRPNSAIYDMSFVQPPPREKRARVYMEENPMGGRCSRCGESVPVRGDTEACVCSGCLQMLARLESVGYWDEEEALAASNAGKTCYECGAERPKGKRKGLCPKCARTRKRDMARERARSGQ